MAKGTLAAQRTMAAELLRERLLRTSHAGYRILQTLLPALDDPFGPQAPPEASKSLVSMALPSLREIFAAFRSPEQEAELSRTAFSRFLAFILSCTTIAVLASRSVQKAAIKAG